MKYFGQFYRKSIGTVEGMEGFEAFQNFNEDGEEYGAAVRDAEREAYIALVLPDGTGRVVGLDKDGFFSFYVPYHVYTFKESEVPSDALETMSNWKVVDGKFVPYFDIHTYKYNCQLSIRDMRISLAIGETHFDKAAVDKFEAEVEKFDGEGSPPAFTN